METLIPPKTGSSHSLETDAASDNISPLCSLPLLSTLRFTLGVSHQPASSRARSRPGSAHRQCQGRAWQVLGQATLGLG